ncbi:MAG TPA: permease-like cell division protein FtsX [Nitrospiria bacterium]
MRLIVYFFKEMFLSLRENKVVTLITTVTIAFAMMLFGLFLLVYLNLNAVAGVLRQEIKIILYLKDGISAATLASLTETLRLQAGVGGVEFTSKEKALEDFKRAFEGNDLLLKGLGQNPLPASIELTVAKDYQSSRAVERLADQVKGLNGVDDIQYGHDWVRKVGIVLDLLKTGSTVSGLILGLAAVVIISSTIGLTVWARLPEIEVLKLIGATRMYIQMPFLLEGAFMGLIGGALSLFFIRSTYLLVKNRLSEIGGILGGGMTFSFLPPAWLGMFLGIGVVLGLIGSFLSVRRFV